MMSDYPDAMFAQPIAIVTAASREMGAACVRCMVIDGDRDAMMFCNNEAREGTGGAICMDGDLTRAVR